MANDRTTTRRTTLDRSGGEPTPGNAGCRNEGPKHRSQAEPHDASPIAAHLSKATGNYAHSRRRTVAYEFTATWFLEASAGLRSRAEGDRGTNCKTTDVIFRVAPPNVGTATERREGAKTRRQTNHPKSRILLPTQIPTTLKIDTLSLVQLSDHKRSHFIPRHPIKLKL
jgi:hypothetical protein